MGVAVREKKAGSGVWWVFINHSGKRTSKRVGDKKTANEVAEKIRAKLVLGEFDIAEQKKKQSGPVFKEYSEMWLEGYVKGLRRASTHERYGDILRRYVNPVIGKAGVDQIKKKDIRDLLLKHHAAGLSNATVGLIKDVVSGVMEYAIEDEIIQSNPARSMIKRLNLTRDKKMTIEPMKPEDVSLFLDTAKKYYPEHYAFFLTAFRTGARLGELIGLHFSGVDWNEKSIKIERTIRRGVVTAPKNGKSRIVDMSNQLAGELRQLLKIRKMEALKEGIGEPEEIIFHRKHEYMDQKYIRRIWERILKKAGMRHSKFHITRHTYASLLLSNNESPVYVKEQLGHHSIQITVDIYGHLIKTGDRGAVNKLDDCKSMQEGADGVQADAKLVHF